MKVIHYKRGGSLNPDGTIYLYVPDEDIVMFNCQHDDRGTAYGLLSDHLSLEEARIIASGGDPKVKGATFSDVKELEYVDPRLQKLIEYFRLKEKLQEMEESEGRFIDLEKAVINNCLEQFRGVQKKS